VRGEVAWVAVLVQIDGNHYYSETYRKGQIEIEKWQYDRVLKNPEAAYFTTALELHLKLNRSLGIIGDSKPCPATRLLV
jgi:hypothetical protein